MERLFKLLKATSEYASHNNNMAKEYILREDGSHLTLGDNCFYLNGHYYEILENEAIPIDMKKSVLCYGISISNIVSMIEKAGDEVVSIFRDQDKNYRFYSCYWLTIKPKIGRVETIRFDETVRINDFCGTELYHHLLNLYNIK